MDVVTSDHVTKVGGFSFDIDSLNKNMTEMIQRSSMSIAKQTKKQKKPKISSPTRAIMKKRREMKANETPRDNIEYVDIM